MHMNRRLLFLLPVGVFSPFATAQSLHADRLTMINGDQFTGDVQGLTDGVLSVKVAYAQGTLSIQWSQVASVHSDHLFLVKTQEGKVYTGKLASTSGSLLDLVSIATINTQQQVADVTQGHVVSITPTSEGFWRRLDGSVNTGILFSKGNESLQYSVSSEVVYNTALWHTQADFGSTLSSNSGANVATRNRGSINTLRLVGTSNWFLGSNGSILQSSVQQIRAETSLGAGVGRYLKNTNRVSIDVLGGFGWQQVNYSGGVNGQGVPNTAVSFLSADVKAFKFKKTSLNVSATVLPALTDLGRVRINTNAIYYIKIIGDLSFNMSFYGNWDNRPPLSVPGSDYGSSSGFSWTFGNR
jgi:hypothetical protein